MIHVYGVDVKKIKVYKFEESFKPKNIQIFIVFWAFYFDYFMSITLQSLDKN